MRNKAAKKLKELAKGMTVGKSKQETKRRYKQLKKVHKSIKSTDK